MFVSNAEKNFTILLCLNFKQRQKYSSEKHIKSDKHKHVYKSTAGLNVQRDLWQCVNAILGSLTIHFNIWGTTALLRNERVKK